MCVNQARLERRRKRRSLKSLWKRETLSEAAAYELTLDGFSGEMITEEDIAVVWADEDDFQVDVDIEELAGMTVDASELPFGFHIVNNGGVFQRQLELRSLIRRDYAGDLDLQGLAA